MSKVKVYDRFNPPPSRGLVCNDGMTQAEFAVECDINHIMDKYTRTGTVATRTDMGRFGDFSNVGDFQDAQNLIIKSRGQFSALSSKVRARFENDPGKFLAWVHDPKRVSGDFEEVGMDMSSEFVKRKAEAAAAVVPPVAK